MANGLALPVAFIPVSVVKYAKTSMGRDGNAFALVTSMRTAVLASRGMAMLPDELRSREPDSGRISMVEDDDKALVCAVHLQFAHKRTASIVKTTDVLTWMIFTAFHSIRRYHHAAAACPYRFA